MCIVGHFFIAIIPASVGYFAIEGNNAGILTSILAFFFVYHNSTGPVAWLYAIETTIDVAFGVCVFTLWGTSFLLTLICPILMSDIYLGPCNVFFMFSGLSVLGSIYSYIFLRESKGLSDKEKKLLFTPLKYKKVEEMVE